MSRAALGESQRLASTTPIPLHSKRSRGIATSRSWHLACRLRVHNGKHLPWTVRRSLEGLGSAGPGSE